MLPRENGRRGGARVQQSPTTLPIVKASQHAQGTASAPYCDALRNMIEGYRSVLKLLGCLSS